MDPALTNTSLKPTEVNDEPWLYCCDEEIRGKYSHVKERGKWMMFFKKDILDEKWASACQLYRQGKLTGIASMKVSTDYENERASDESTGVINFYCGPVRDRAAVMEYGKILLQQFPYKTKFGYMFYKSDEQTARGTRATGRKKNSLYKMSVPGDEEDSDDDGEWREWQHDRWLHDDRYYEEQEEEELPLGPVPVAIDPNYTNKKLKPSEVTTHPYLYWCDEQVRQQYSHVNWWGKWLMFFPKEILDEKWAQACDLYQSGKLIGIPLMKVSTAQDNPRASDRNTGVIAFYCGPSDDKRAMMELGRMILIHFPYENDCGYMYYKSEEQSARGTRATGREKNSLYKLAVLRSQRRFGNLDYGYGPIGSQVNRELYGPPISHYQADDKKDVKKEDSTGVGEDLEENNVKKPKEDIKKEDATWNNVKEEDLEENDAKKPKLEPIA